MIGEDEQPFRLQHSVALSKDPHPGDLRAYRHRFAVLLGASALMLGQTLARQAEGAAARCGRSLLAGIQVRDLFADEKAEEDTLSES